MEALKQYSTAELLDELCGRDGVISLPKCNQTVHFRAGTSGSIPIPPNATIIAVTAVSEVNRDFTARLIALVGETEAKAIKQAIRNKQPILIKGPQGPTGKTTLCRLINENGGTAVEEKLCYSITLEKPVSV